MLLSGGMDSAFCLAWALRWFDSVDAVAVNYGQRHACELDAARLIAAATRTRLHVCTLCALGASSLTTPTGQLAGPDVVVPGRNMALLSLAAHLAPLPDALVFGACAADQELFEDCRPDFFAAAAAELRVPIHTPAIELTKAGVLQAAHEYGATSLIERSWSCYAGGSRPCGACGACEARALAKPCPACKTGGEPTPAGHRCHHPSFGYTPPCLGRVW